MSETKFTPGPYEVGFDGPSRPIITTADHSMLSISKYEMGQWGSYENEIHDAHLLAAAPELYAALERLYAWERDFYDIADRALKMGLPPIEWPGSSSCVDSWLEANIYGPVEVALKKARGEA